MTVEQPPENSWSEADDVLYRQEITLANDPLTTYGPLRGVRIMLVGAIERSHDPEASETFGSNMVRLIEDIAKVMGSWRQGK